MISAIKKGRSRAEAIFSRKKSYCNIRKNQAGSITFRLRQIHGQSLKEIDFFNRNSSDRF